MTADPNLLLIGAARSGTTAAAEILGSHPEISFSQPKEIHFFAHHGAERHYDGPGDTETVQRNIVVDPDHMRRCFDPAARFRGEGSVSTLYMPDTSIRNILVHAAEDVKLLVLLREPAARAFSAYQYLRARGYEDATDFEAALNLEDERRRAGYHHMWHYRAMSRYREQLQPFVDTFGSRLHITIFEEFIEDQARHTRNMLRFLDVDDLDAFDLPGAVNGSGEPRSGSLLGLMRTTRRNPWLLRLVRATTSTRLRERVREANLQRPNESPPILHTLYDELEGERQFVESLLGRPLPSWRTGP